MLLAVLLLSGAPSFPDTALDFNVKNAGAERVYASLGSTIGKSVQASCVADERVTLSLPGASVAVIFDALAASLGVSYAEGDAGVEVRCLPSGKLPPGTYLMGGAILAPASPALREYFGAPGSVGMWVRAVAPGSAAAQAGLQVGDLVVDVDGQGAGSGKDIDAILSGSKEAIQTAELRVLRAKETYRFAVVVKDNRRDLQTIDRMGLEGMNRQKRENTSDTKPKLWTTPE